MKSLVHATEILRAFQSPGETLRLRDVMDRTRFSKGMCFRLLYTLHYCGLVEKVDTHRYRLTAEIRRRKRYRIGYAAQGQQDSSFPREVHEGLLRAAEREQVELIVVDNRYQPKIALRNAEQLIRAGIDLVIEFQTDEAIAPAIASRYHEAGVPMIAIDIPHPGATYFGANNYEAGLLAGRYLGKWAKQQWHGQADELLLVEIARAGPLPRARVRGILAGVKETLRDLEPATSCRLTATASSRPRSNASAVICGRRRRSTCWWAPPTIRARWARRARSRKRAARPPARSPARTPSPTRARSCAPRARRSSRRSAIFPRNMVTG